jgi:hypothetical protein
MRIADNNLMDIDSNNIMRMQISKNDIHILQIQLQML